METFNKYMPLLALLGIISAIAGGIYFFGGFMNAVESGVLTPEQKIKIIKHEEMAPNDVDTYIMYKTVDSIFKVEKKDSKDAIRSRAVRDSLIADAKDIANKNAVQIYQMKQQQDTIIKLLKSK